MFVSQQEVLEMECRLFFSRFKNQATVLRMQEKISASRSTHQADALKLGLQTALDLRKRNSCILPRDNERNFPGKTVDGIDRGQGPAARLRRSSQGPGQLRGFLRT